MEALDSKDPSATPSPPPPLQSPDTQVAPLPAMAAQRLLATSTKIIGVGRNYVAHAKELGNPVPKVPSSDPPIAPSGADPSPLDRV
jgi:2-keto-4-pentenoate hydratase/2-oxohepta-3-ene-1,7-dioic acid hydratase in catechol pathway